MAFRVAQYLRDDLERRHIARIDGQIRIDALIHGTPLRDELLDAGASVNDAEYNPDASVLLEALNVKAAPQIITMLVERGADTKREGEVYDAKSGESFRGTPAELAQARGYGENVIGLLR